MILFSRQQRECGCKSPEGAQGNNPFVLDSIGMPSGIAHHEQPTSFERELHLQLRDDV
jgi:hypothetical protein